MPTLSDLAHWLTHNEGVLFCLKFLGCVIVGWTIAEVGRYVCARAWTVRRKRLAQREFLAMHDALVRDTKARARADVQRYRALREVK